MAVEIRGTVRRGGTCALMARVVDADAELISRSNVASVSYSIYLIGDRDANNLTDVDGHTGVAVGVDDCVSDTLSTDKGWTADATGWNFRHVIDVSGDVAFELAGRRYLVEVRITPTAGQVIVVPFYLYAI